MKKMQILETTKNIKDWLDIKYHDLLDTNIFNIHTNFNIKNCINCALPHDNMECLNKYYKNISFYKKNITKAKEIKLPYVTNKQDDDIDFILLEYIKYTKNVLPIILWPTIASKTFFQDKKSKPFMDFLHKNGKILIIKLIKLTKKQAESFIFQIYSSSAHFKIYQNLLHGLKMKQFKKDTDNPLIIIFWVPKLNNKIYFGDNNLQKKKLRNLLFKTYEKELSDDYSDDEYKKKDLIHITNCELETIELAQLIFNRNSLEMMKYQRMDILIGKYRKFTKSIIILNLYKKILYLNFQLIDINRFLAFSSIVLFALGLRDINDIDAFFYHKPGFISSETDKLKYLIDEFISENLGGKKRQVIEFTVKGYGDWDFKNYKEYPHKWFEEKLPKLYGANTYENVIFNPKFHFYFLGIKCVSYQGDFARRASRNRPASIADLIAVNRMTHLKINIPKLPEKIWVNHKEITIDDKEKNNIIRKIKNYLEYRYSIFINQNEIDKLID
jgi:hypothetical protein